MSIEERLNDALKDAMRAREQDTVACVRQIKAKMQETVNAPGFKDEVNDALYQKVIGSYVKSLKRGIDELAAAGDKSAALRGRYEAEIAYLSDYLPSLLDEAATRKIVTDVIAGLGVADPKQMGRVIGAVMKDHKGQVDPALVRQLIEEALAPPS